MASSRRESFYRTGNHLSQELLYVQRKKRQFKFGGRRQSERKLKRMHLKEHSFCAYQSLENARGFIPYQGKSQGQRSLSGWEEGERVTMVSFQPRPGTKWVPGTLMPHWLLVSAQSPDIHIRCTFILLHSSPSQGLHHQGANQ